MVVHGCGVHDTEYVGAGRAKPPGFYLIYRIRGGT
jgi:hypothetical protein